MTELWLVRHGQTDWNLQGRWQGQSPHAPGLNDTGRAQAITACEQLRDKRFSAIYSSDLLRSRQTAELLAEPLSLTVALEPRLREINLGVWEGMLSDDIAAQYPQELAEREQDSFHTHAPQGEAPLDVAKRVIRAMDDIAKKHSNELVLIVAHGVSLAIIICHAQGIPMNEIYAHIPKNAQSYCLKWK